MVRFYNIAKILLFVAFGSPISHSQDAVIPIDTEGEVYSVHTSENGLIYYIQDGTDNVYKAVTKEAWLKVYDGYRTYSLHKLEIDIRSTSATKMHFFSKDEILIVSGHLNYLYNTNSNQLTGKLKGELKNKRRFISESGLVYSTGSGHLKEGVCYHNVNKGRTKEVLCSTDLSSVFYLFSDNFLTFTYTQKTDSTEGIYDGWRVYGLDGELVLSLELDEINEKFPVLNLKSSFIDKYYWTPDGLKFYLEGGNWIFWDGYKHFEETEPPEKDTKSDINETKIKIQKIGEGSTFLVFDKEGTILREENIKGVPSINDLGSNELDKLCWLATEEGLLKVEFDNNKVRQVIQKHSIRAIYPYNDEYLLVGTVTNAFYLVQRENSNGIEPKVIETISRSFENNFITRMGNDIFVFSHYNLYKYLPTGKTKVKNLGYQSVYEKYNEQKLLRTREDYGLELFGVKNHEILNFPNSSDSSMVLDMLLLPNEKVAMATDNGLFIYDLELKKPILCDTSKAFGLSLFSYKDTRFFIGYEDGTLREYSLEKKTFKVIREFDIGESVATINRTDDKHLWLGTFNGIARLDLDNGNIIYLDKEEVSHRECNRYASFYDSTYNKLYIGTIKGLNIINTKKDLFESNSFNLYFTQLSYSKNDTLKTKHVFNKEEISLTLPVKDRGCKLSFTINNINKIKNIEYRYRLNEGLWSAYSPSNELSMSYIGSGENMLEIQGKSREGTMSTNTIRAQIYATPIFYETWWFRGLLGALIIGTSFFWYRRIKSENKRLEETVKERTVQLEEEQAKIQKQANDLEKLNDLKNQFFANISHELRTPLTLLISPLDKLRKDGNMSENQKFLLQLMKDNGKLLQDRIEELLELSRLAAKEVTLARQTINLFSLVDFSTRIFKSRASDKNIEYIIEQSGTDVNVICDEKRLAKIIQNLIGNAIKFTPKNGKVDIDISFVDERLSISVLDTGIGISSDELEKIFDRFYQVKVDNKNANPGTGIGLSMV